jgi:hypothetical protein
MCLLSRAGGGGPDRCLWEHFRVGRVHKSDEGLQYGMKGSRQNMKIRCLTAIVILTVVPLCALAVSIAEDDVDSEKIFWGNSQQFSKAAEINLVALIEKTPEYKNIVKEKMDSSGAKYWILMTQAQERVTKSIVRVARKKQFDLVCEAGYLGALSIEAKDITALVEKDLAGKSE